MSSIKGTAPDDDVQARILIIQHLKSQGIFDAMRRECLADIDTKPAFINLTQRIEQYVSRFLTHQEWDEKLNKNQLREKLRKNLNESEMMKYGVEHLVDGAVHSKQRSFYPQIQNIVREFLGIEEENKPVKNENDFNEKDMDTAEQDMDVDEDSNLGHDAQPKIETFIKAFREAKTEEISVDDDPGNSSSSFQPKISLVLKSSTEVTPTKTTVVEPSYDHCQDLSQGSIDNSIPTDMDTDDSNEAKNPTDLILEVKKSPVVEQPQTDTPIVKMEDTTHGLDMKTEVGPVTDRKGELEDIKPETIPLPTTAPSTDAPFEGTTKIIVKKDPKEEVEPQKAVKELVSKPVKVKQTRSTDSSKNKNRKERRSVEISEPAAPLEEILSDVSSVHTSDLSDFDDRISISSDDDEDVDEKNEKSQKEIKKSSNKKTKVIAVHQEVVAIEATTSRRGRERKVNPKYASDDYSSIYSRNKKGNVVSNSMEEDIDSEEDFDFQEGDKEKDDSIQGRHDDVDASEGPLTIDVKLEEKVDDVSIASPTASSECSSTTTSSSNVKQPKKRGARRPEAQTQRYDASDLYKPRPVIGSSRRNRSTQPPADT